MALWANSLLETIYKQSPPVRQLFGKNQTFLKEEDIRSMNEKERQWQLWRAKPKLLSSFLQRIENLKILVTYQNVSGVWNGSDDSGSNHQFFPGLWEVNDVNSFIVALEHVWVHQVWAVLSANVYLNREKFRFTKSKSYVGSQHVGNILFFCLWVSKVLAETHLDLLVLSGIHLNI